jgi:hypothetical protein
MSARLNRCACGRMPAVRAMRVAEDAMSTWVQCPDRRCGAVGEDIEDAYRDDATAIELWNRKGGRKP